jgi:hypothetical protein
LELLTGIKRKYKSWTEKKTRKVLTIHGQHNPKADTDRLYVPRKDGGRGLMQIKEAYITEVIKLKE